MSSRTIKITISYDGTSYVGWQVQPNGTSIQGLLQDALHSMTSERSAVVASGRTDAGVHAIAQVAHFRTESNISTDSFVGGLNSYLPGDIAVIGADEMTGDFHAMGSARGKRYVYKILKARGRAPLARNRYWERGLRLEIDHMRAAIPTLIGEHNFESFRAVGCASRDAVKTIHAIDLDIHSAFEMGIARDGKIIELSFEGSGFLRHMIRNIVGTLVDIGEGRFSPEDMQKILDEKNREGAGICAPPHGLYLAEVFY